MRAALRLPALLSAVLSAPLLAMAPPEARPYELPRSMVAGVEGPGGSYEVMIAWPEGEPPAAGWPVLYVLDGEDNFAITALTARRLARAGARSGVAAGIVVGIAAGPLPRRVRDYTPATPDWVIPRGRPAHGLATGGAEAFLDSVERQVMPLVHDGRWPIDRTRETLVGHSFGGLLALHAAATRPALFDGVVAVSPSLWFGDGLVEREVRRAPIGPRILISEGEGAALENGSTLSRSRQRTRFLPLPGQSHGTTMLAATVPTITFAFGQVDR
ncbi:MAG: alpha/beta hydrolase-fold protein [Sphingomonas phyllosphaerae]|uniref:alpha/beta hydrolase n=1 Tax=Sphingomonas phyllosphaerae TaxID=257003 RepID=UPI002FF9DFE2